MEKQIKEGPAGCRIYSRGVASIKSHSGTCVSDAPASSLRSFIIWIPVSLSLAFRSLGNGINPRASLFPLDSRGHFHRSACDQNYILLFFISAILEILMPRAVFDASHFYFHSDSALHGNTFSECVVIPKEKETVKIRQSYLNGECIVYFSYTYSSCVCIFHILISQIFLCVCTRWPHESESENENGFRHRQDREAFESI